SSTAVIAPQAARNTPATRATRPTVVRRADGSATMPRTGTAATPTTTNATDQKVSSHMTTRNVASYLIVGVRSVLMLRTVAYRGDGLHDLAGHGPRARDGHVGLPT